MNTSAILFYAIASLILGSALLAVTSLKIFRSAIWLLFSLVGIAEKIILGVAGLAILLPDCCVKKIEKIIKTTIPPT